jgi:hypothetical protein
VIRGQPYASVIPAKAGTQCLPVGKAKALGSGFRRNDEVFFVGGRSWRML